MNDAARLAVVILRLVALCMMAVGPAALVGQAIIEPSAYGSLSSLALMLVGAAIISVPGYLLYRLAPRLGRFVARGID